MTEFILVHSAQAHSGEEEEAPIGSSDYLGPILALIIIIAAVFIARRIHKKKRHESNTNSS